MIKPPDWKRGQDITAARLREMSQAIRELQNQRRQTTRGGKSRPASAAKRPWEPTIAANGANYTAVLTVGTLNGLVPSNYSNAFNLTADTTYWPTLDVTTSNGQITGVTISMDTTPPAQTTINESTPPGSFKIILGVIRNTTYAMAHNTNLSATTSEVFRVDKTSLTIPGEEPSKRYYEWIVTGM